MKGASTTAIRRAERSGVALAGEAAHLLVTAPVGTVACYFAGSVPFVVGLLYFWSEMSRSALAGARCLPWALALAALFVWMKTWQAAFAAGLLAWVGGREAPRWTAGRTVRAVLQQAAVQPSGLLVIPAAMLLAVPFHAAHAFYQNVTVLGDGTERDLRAVVRAAARQAVLWVRQNVVVIWLLSPWTLGVGLIAAFGTAWLVARLSPDLRELGEIVWMALGGFLIVTLVLPVAPLGTIVAANLGVAIAMLPWMARTFLGIEAPFAAAGASILFNTTFLAAVFASTYLCLDPLCKAAHVLRCFYGRSLQTGEDLLAELRALERDDAEGRT